MRYVADALFCSSFADKESIGDAVQWTIRTGGLSSRSIVYSGGVGEDISFETTLARRFGLSIVLFDPSPPALETVRTADMTNIAFVPQGLSGEGGAAAFEMCARGTGKEWKIAKAQTGALSAPCTTIHEQMRMRGHQVIDLLKIDIEGFEYGVLRDCIDRRIPIQQICVEFHHFFEDISPGETLRTMHLLKRAGFTLIHKHMCDMTFYRL